MSGTTNETVTGGHDLTQNAEVDEEKVWSFSTTLSTSKL